MALLRSPVAGPHPGRLQPPLQRVGALLWWRFIDAATGLPTLAGSARRAGFPAIFLPVPFPVSYSVAFQRALRRAAASVPARIGGRWTADRVAIPGRSLEAVLKHHGIDPDTRKARLAKLPTLDLTFTDQVGRWEPSQDPGRPWLAKILCAVEPKTGKLLTVVTSPSPKTDRTDRMLARIRKMYDRERNQATYPEIGAGVMDALEDVGGVKLRPGLYSVPGQAGIDRADAALKYLRSIGSTRAGIMDLYDEPQEATAPEGLVQIALQEEIEALAAELEPAALEPMQTAALRTQWERIGALEERILANRLILGPASEELLRHLEPPRKRVRKIALGKKVELTRRRRPADVRNLKEALEALRLVAKRGDVAGFREARPLLVRAQPAALAGGFAPLLRRLRKLADATEHVHEGPLYQALEEAVGFVEGRARAAYPLDFGEPGPRGRSPGD